MNRQELTITSHNATPDITVITLAGELDLGTEELVRTETTTLLDSGRTRLVFDLASLRFCDSTGMGNFIDLNRTTRARQGWLRLAALTPFVLKSVPDTQPRTDPRHLRNHRNSRRPRQP